MISRRNAVENPVIARKMKRFFRGLGSDQRTRPEDVAIAYARYLYSSRKSLVCDKNDSLSRYYIGLGVESIDFGSVTKRAALIADSLVLSHFQSGPYCNLGTLQDGSVTLLPIGGTECVNIHIRNTNYLNLNYGFKCPDLSVLGRWVLDAEPLLRAGLAWYLPSYATVQERVTNHIKEPLGGIADEGVIEYLVRDGGVVAVSDECPLKSDLVRPIMDIDLPFIDGVSLSVFSKITIEEFESYRGFRDFMRDRLLSMDQATASEQSGRELALIEQEIRGEVRRVKIQMDQVRRSRAVAVTGAAVGTVTAALVAVYGPAFQTVAGLIGAGGWLPALQVMADNRKRPIKEDRWYYVWVLSKKAKRG